MPYPGQFHRLVVIGNLYSDIFNFSLSIVPSGLGELGMPAVDDATLAAVGGDVSTWWSSTPGLSFNANAVLTSIKLNRIGPDGHYVDPETKEHSYGSGIPGSAAGNIPAQLSTAITLFTAVPRGRGSRGRFYYPPHNLTLALGTDGRLSGSTASDIATHAKGLLVRLNTRYTAIGRVGVASNAGSGRFEHCLEVGAGRVVDTMRSRRSKLQEEHIRVTV